MKKKVIVLDKDDTLTMNEWLYSKATFQYMAFLYKVFGDTMPANGKAIQALYEKIDGPLFDSWGVRRGRVAEGMVQHYRWVYQLAQEKFGIEFHKNQHWIYEQDIRKIGDQPFDYSDIKLLDGAVEVIRELIARGHIVCILSSYDKKMFPINVQKLGLDTLIDSACIHATEFGKKKEDFIRASGWTKEKDSEYLWVAVGNGKSDILPALEISENWRGVYIPFGSGSAYFGKEEQVNLKPPSINHPCVKTINSLKELPPALSALR